MKVLVLLHEPPLLEGGSPERYAVALLRGLRSHGVEVSALAARHEKSIPGDPPADVPVNVIDVRLRPRSVARRLLRPRGELANGAFEEQVRALAQDADVLHLEETRTARCGVDLSTQAVVHLHYLVRGDRAWGFRPGGRALSEMVEYVLSERETIRRHRRLVASSPLVAQALRERAPGADVVLSPLALDPSDYPLAPLDGPPTAGIIGLGDWPPTRSAIERLVERIWPHVRRRVPNARLVIAGRRTQHLAGLPLGEGVEVAGEVQSGRAFLRSLSLLVYPPERGSGMKMKVLESIASGLPVVTTPAGAEGIEAGDGMLVESDDDRLAAAVASLLVDEGERRERGAAGRAAFERRYSPKPATEPLVDLYRRMADNS